jgi:surface protein
MSRDLYIKAKAPAGDWTRPSDWLPMPTGITSANQTFIGLHAVIEDGDNYVAFLFTTSAGQYEVDWGDGSTPTLHNSNTRAEYQYNFATYDTGNTTLSSRGYKQAIITVTAVSGNLLTCSFQQRFVTSPVQNQAYSTGFLDCILSMPNASSGTSIVFGGFTVGHRYVERMNVLTIGGCTSLQNFFQNCVSLQYIPLFNTSNITSMVSMFQTCSSIKLIPFFNTSNVTTMASMFNGCVSLQYIPLFDTSSVTNMGVMFNQCFSLQKLPLFVTTLVINMQDMFGACQSLESIPALSTVGITPTTGVDFNTWNGVSISRISVIFARTVNLSNCQLSQTALVEIFNNLVDRTSTTSATINITGNWGASALTAGERLIATNKNWVIVG